MDAREALAILGFAPDARPLPTREQVRRAYKVAAGAVHPDVGGTHEEFSRLHEAYQIIYRLIDANTKALLGSDILKKCEGCQGTGHFKETRGASQIRVVCIECGGQGVVLK